MSEFPVLRQTVLDCPDPRALAEFYRRLLGYRYRPGDETPTPGEPDPRGQRRWCIDPLTPPSKGQTPIESGHPVERAGTPPFYDDAGRG